MHPENQSVGKSTLGLGSGAENQAGEVTPLRGWLAGEEALTVNEQVDWKTAFAGKPAPTEVLRVISERCW
jgi:hypothetical protein